MEEGTYLPELGVGPTDLRSGERSVPSMLTAAMCGYTGCASSRGTPQRKPVGAGIQPGFALAQPPALWEQ